MYLIEKMRYDKEVDVFVAVRNMRDRSHEFVPTMVSIESITSQDAFLCLFKTTVQSVYCISVHGHIYFTTVSYCISCSNNGLNSFFV